ncbi:MAG: adenosylhomocysteinase [Solirubrobacteraceae bacterium]|jgi:adenosylhomocysteinase|nr:adenosylhomocysteinase [Solirubrobacteraceae bacterium]
MPVLRSVADRFKVQRPLEGVRVAACLHVTAETANLVHALQAGGAEVAVCAANPLSTQDDVAEVLGIPDRRGSDPDYVAALKPLPDITIDDGADLISIVHMSGKGDRLRGGTEETTAGLLRIRQMELKCPVIAVNEARTERLFNDHYGTGQSTLDGILRATNLLLAGKTIVVLGYGETGRGIAARARGAGGQVIVCEVDPMRALEARMEGFEVMPALEAATRGDLFITVTGSRDVLRGEHFERMKPGAVLANAGHFDVEICLAELGEGTQVLPLVTQHGHLNLLAQGRVVNLAAGQGHPAEIMDLSFANQALATEYLVKTELDVRVHPVPLDIDREIARLKLVALGVGIDTLTDAQRDYLTTWT